MGKASRAGRKVWGWIGGATAVGALWSFAAQAQELLPPPAYVFKGTHNSYTRCPGAQDCPVMHHGVAAQIDSFGVWQLELDGGTEDPGYVTIYIGHDHPGSGREGHGYTHARLNE